MNRLLALLIAACVTSAAIAQTSLTIPAQTVPIPAAPQTCVTITTSPTQTLCGPGLTISAPPSCTTPQPTGQSQTVACPAGTTGSWTQTRAYVAAPAPTCWTAGAWTPAMAPAGACVTSTPPVTPAVPTNVKATAQPYTVMVSFTESSAPAGKKLVNYTTQSLTQGWIQGSSPHSPVMAQGGNPGAIQGDQFEVKANYSDGTSSAWSAPSNAIKVTGGTGPSTSPNILVGGVFYWQGDFSYGMSGIQYGDTLGGGTPTDFAFYSNQSGGWQPYSPTNDFDLTPYTYLYVDLKPNDAGQTFGLFFELPGDQGAPGEQVVSIDGTAKYGPVPVASKWGNYKIPLSAFNVGNGTASPHIYKLQIHCGLASPSLWFVNNVYFSAK